MLKATDTHHSHRNTVLHDTRRKGLCVVWFKTSQTQEPSCLSQRAHHLPKQIFQPTLPHSKFFHRPDTQASTDLITDLSFATNVRENLPSGRRGWECCVTHHYSSLYYCHYSLIPSSQPIYLAGIWLFICTKSKGTASALCRTI